MGRKYIVMRATAGVTDMVPAHVDLGEASLANLGADDELPDSFVAGPRSPRGRGNPLFSHVSL